MREDIRLRRLEIQVHYDTAFIWLDTRGAIGQKWGYSGRFGRWRIEADALVLTGEHETETNVGAFGMRQATLVTEGFGKFETAFGFAQQWLDDCLTAVRHFPIVRRVSARVGYFQALQNDNERAKVQASLLRRFPGIESLNPTNATINSGVSFNSTTTTPLGNRLSSILVGTLLPEQRGSQLLRDLPGDGIAGDFGYFADWHQQLEVKSAELGPVLEELKNQARLTDQHLRSILVPVVKNA